MKRGDRPETTLPFVHPGVTDPKALAYQRDLAARKANPPIAGGPTPPIPPLNQAAAEGRTIAQQGEAHRAFTPQGIPDESIFKQPQGSAQNMTPPAPETVQQTDQLPDAARNDPNFQTGMGSMMAMSQPDLAKKYGVMRNGKFIPPQQLAGTAGKLRPETAKGLEDLINAQKHTLSEFEQTVQKTSSPEAAAQAQAAAGPGGAAARAGNSLGDDNINPASSTEKERLRSAVQGMDDFDYDTFRQLTMRDLLNNDKQRETVEKRCSPLDLGDLIIKNFVSQIVPVVPGQFEPEFQSLSAEDDLALKRLVMLEGKKIEAPERYLLDKYTLMCVAAGIRSLNKNPLPDYRDSEGNFNEEAFWKKFNRVIKWPLHLISSLGVHYYWFDIRVRKLFVAPEAVGNG